MGSGITSGECQAPDTINISEEAVSRWLYTSADTIIITIIIPTIWCLGIITNFTFLFVLLRVPKFRSDTNIYLMHLALADLLYVCLGATLDTWRYAASLVARHFPFVNSAECVSFLTVTNTGYFASIALVTMVSFERFFALCHPIKHLKIRGKQRTRRLVAICWLVGLLFSGSTVPGFAILNMLCLQWPNSDKYQGFPSMTAYCGAVQPWVSNYTVPLLNVPWLIAMVANIYMYIRILQTLNKPSGSNTNRKKDRKAQQIRNQVAKMLIVNGVVFFICQTPYRVISLSGWICSLAQIHNPISAALGSSRRWVSIIPQYINTIVNPLIYGATNSMYRTAFKQAFQCKGHTRQQPSVKSLSALSTAEKSNTTAETLNNSENSDTEL